jgi:hypothetical protein
MLCKNVSKHIEEDMTTTSSEIGFTTYASKTKYMINRNKNGNEPEGINRHKYKSAKVFKRLHSWVTNTNEADAEIRARIISGNKCYQAPKERYTV